MDRPRMRRGHLLHFAKEPLGTEAMHARSEPVLDRARVGLEDASPEQVEEMVSSSEDPACDLERRVPVASFDAADDLIERSLLWKRAQLAKHRFELGRRHRSGTKVGLKSV
ncbi:MAG: hypothetical protein F9K40_01910 [Kofleriaceae bacterium]|nr:MAG: hypothetical protein F9K40_01910 [Kofleriaceae bacterium]MBZ0237147.1 hypothetical protein [Kofleriaceae bacterium]